MVNLWFTKIKLGINNATLEDVPERYYEQVKEKLIEAGLYEE